MRNYQAARGMHTAFLLDCKSMAERPAYKDISREQMPGNAGALRVQRQASGGLRNARSAHFADHPRASHVTAMGVSGRLLDASTRES